MKDFIKEIITLTKSLVIKIDYIALQINAELEKSYIISIDPDDKTTWKYYLNLSGEYHETDSDILIYVSELKEERVLTKDLLTEYPRLHTELLKLGTVYKSLLEKYPTYGNLIRGIILPVDINTAIDSPDGSILNYNNSFIEPQESYLIKALNEYTVDFIARWYIRLYSITDDLYIASVLNTLYSKIPAKIFNLRLDKVFTHEAHSFHMDEAFKSTRDIYEDTTVLREDVKTWLYKNLRYLQTHTGKNSTLDKLIENILSPAGIGIGKVNMVKNDIVALETSYNDISKNLYDKPDINFKTEELNKEFFINSGKVSDSDTILLQEISLNENDSSILGDSFEYYKSILDSKLSNVTRHTTPTKILEIDKVGEFTLSTIPEFLVILDNFMYLANNDTLKFTKEFLDPNTVISYDLTPKQASLVLLKLFATAMGKDDILIDSFKCMTSLNQTLSVSELTNNTIDREELSKLTSVIVDLRPSIGEVGIDNISDFNLFLLNLTNMNNKLWEITNNVNNAILSSGLKTVQNRLLEEADIDLTVNGEVKTINELLVLNNIDFITNDIYDYQESIKELLLAFTGININTTENIENIIEKYTNIVRKFTSYTVHFIHEKNDESSLAVGYTEFETFSTVKPLFNIDSMVFNELEQFYSDIIYLLATPYIDDLLTYSVSPELTSRLSVRYVDILATTTSIGANSIIVSNKPIVTVTTKDEFIGFAKPNATVTIFSEEIEAVNSSPIILDRIKDDKEVILAFTDQVTDLTIESINNNIFAINDKLFTPYKPPIDVSLYSEQLTIENESVLFSYKEKNNLEKIIAFDDSVNDIAIDTINNNTVISGDSLIPFSYPTLGIDVYNEDFIIENETVDITYKESSNTGNIVATEDSVNDITIETVNTIIFTKDQIIKP